MSRGRRRGRRARLEVPSSQAGPSKDHRYANRGKEWERDCAQLLDLSAARKALVWWRTPETFVQVGSHNGDGAFLAKRTGEGPPDVHILIDGVAVAADWKESQKGRLPWDSIQLHQARALDDYVEQGGRSALLVRLRKTGPGTVYVLDWSRCSPLWWAWHQRNRAGVKSKRGQASVARDDLESLGWRHPRNAMIHETLRRLTHPVAFCDWVVGVRLTAHERDVVKRCRLHAVPGRPTEERLVAWVVQVDEEAGDTMPVGGGGIGDQQVAIALLRRWRGR